ncbi:MAG: endonuclease [Schleiferiaceae bacterium]|nr:endonuclease [Schleiferiaceae bacterium]MDR9442726.1 endonuclease [Schleiferiaceae bacterium]
MATTLSFFRPLWQRGWLTFGLGAILSSATLAQSLNSQDTVLSWGGVDETQSVAETLWVRNTRPVPVQVSGVDLFTRYGQRPFTVADSQFTIAAQDSFPLVVQFAPQHNVQHKLMLLLRTDAGLGHWPVGLRGQGVYSRNYYSTTRNKEEQALVTALKTRLAQNYSQLSYRVARDNMYGSLDNSGGQVECVYTGRTANFSTRAGANSNSFNCEHTFPQGKFNQSLPMRSDIHHLFPTDVSANSRRANDPFGVVSNANWSQGGSKSGNGKFEPRNAQKGATARAMMYFVLRYQDYGNHFQGQQAILRQWHRQYPPQTAEKQRNNGIYALQNNRNPFVDYPQLSARITDLLGNDPIPQNMEVYVSDDTIALGTGTGQYNYGFVLYNSGDVRVNLNAFTLPAGLNFAQGNPGTVSLDPGEHFRLPIRYDASVAYQGQLSFRQSSTIGFGSRNIPIRSSVSLGQTEPGKAKNWSLYPNPAQDRVQLQPAGALQHWQITDLQGRVVLRGQEAKIEVAQLSAGAYLFRAQDKDGHWQNRRLVIER